MNIEELEPRRVLASTAAAVALPSLNVDFKPASAQTASGYAADVGSSFGNRGNGYTYGWSSDNRANARERFTWAPLRDDTLNHMQLNGSRSWEAAVPNGTYDVTVGAGDNAYADSVYKINVEGKLAVNFTPNSSRQLVQSTIRVNVVDGRLSVTNASGAINNKIGFIRIAPAGATPTPAPTPITSNWPISWRSAATPSVARFESYAFSHGGKTYVLGGWEDGFTGSERNEVFNPATNTWRRLRDIPIPQTHAGFALDERNGVAYAVAGYRGDLPSALTNEFWKYTISTDTWSRMPINAPIKGGAGAAVVMNNKLYHFGGVKDGPDTNTGNHYVLDLSRVSDGWKQLATLPTGRDHLSGVALNGYLYAIGGELGHDRLHAQQKLVHRYNPATNTWARMADLPTAKSHAESSVFVLNGKIVMAGGQVDPQSATREVVQYDPARNAWSRLMSLPAARQGVVVLPAGRYIVVTTGSAYGTFQEQKTTWVGVLS